jgi:hypothetical protein
MTEPFDDEYGERVRRALSTEAEAVTPSPEGLEQIRKKISKRQERRFGLWYTGPLLRPLVAVAAAIFISTIAVSASPALKNFVQTGHFSLPEQGDDGPPIPDQSLNRSAPGNPGHPYSSGTPHPSVTHPADPGKPHVRTGGCALDEVPVVPPGVQAATVSPSPGATYTCQPGGGPTDVPTTPDDPTTPPPPPPPDDPPTDQPTDPQPSAVQQSP